MPLYIGVFRLEYVCVSYTVLYAFVRTECLVSPAVLGGSYKQVKYLASVVEETFRILALSPNAFLRLVHGKGENIERKWVPGSTTVRAVHP
jgi:hypothetical protein